MTVRVLFFALLKAKMKRAEETYAIYDGETISELAQRVLSPVLGNVPLGNFLRFAVNHEYVSPEQGLKDGDEVAFMTPVSGG